MAQRAPPTVGGDPTRARLVGSPCLRAAPPRLGLLPRWAARRPGWRLIPVAAAWTLGRAAVAPGGGRRHLPARTRGRPNLHARAAATRPWRVVAAVAPAPRGPWPTPRTHQPAAAVELARLAGAPPREGAAGSARGPAAGLAARDTGPTAARRPHCPRASVFKHSNGPRGRAARRSSRGARASPPPTAAPAPTTGPPDVRFVHERSGAAQPAPSRRRLHPAARRASAARRGRRRTGGRLAARQRGGLRASLVGRRPMAACRRLPPPPPAAPAVVPSFVRDRCEPTGRRDW